MRTAAGSTTIPLSVATDNRQERLAPQRRSVGRLERTDANLADLLEPLCHDLHVGFHDPLTQPAELFHVLPVNDLAKLLPRDAEFVEQGRYGEKRAEKRVPLHAQLEIGAVSRLACNLETPAA